MRDRVAPAERPRLSASWKAGAPFLLTVGAVLLGWQVAIKPFIQRAPVEFAVRLAPGSPLVLSRAAEAALLDDRHDDAAFLAREALVRAPFTVAALRVAGLSEAKAGRSESADELLTLAGNWSLRDDPTHAWLVEHRLRRGDYGSSFAHADTLARRRTDIQPRVFALFTLAATHDRARVMPILTQLLAARPPWRKAYLSDLYEKDGALQVAFDLAIMLQATDAPMTDEELSGFYTGALRQGQLGAAVSARKELGRPAGGAGVTDGEFSGARAPAPFGWTLVQAGGAIAEISGLDEEGAGSALWVEYDGRRSARIARQFLILPAGSHVLSYRVKVEDGEPAERLRWTLSCVRGPVLASAAPSPAATGVWSTVNAAFTVPNACPGQWLELEGRPGDLRTRTAAWFDAVRVEPAT